MKYRQLGACTTSTAHVHIQVVTGATPWPGGVAALSNSGFGGEELCRLLIVHERRLGLV